MKNGFLSLYSVLSKFIFFFQFVFCWNTFLFRFVLIAFVPEKQIELPFCCYFCLTILLLDIISYNDLFLRIPCKCQWFLVFEGCGWVLVWVGVTLTFLNEMLSCGVYPWLKLAFRNCWLKAHCGNEKEGFEQTEDFVFMVNGELLVRLDEFLSELLAAESFWYSSIISYPTSDLFAILINLFLFFSLSMMDVKEE